MKKFISILLVLSICMITVMCAGVSVGAADEVLNVTVDGVTTAVKVGDTFTYNYTLTDTVIRNCEVRVDYTGSKMSVVDAGEDIDAWVEKTFPVIANSVVYNTYLTDFLVYNCTSQSTYRFNGTQPLCSIDFVAIAAGEASISTKMIEMVDENFEPYVEKTSQGSFNRKDYTHSEFVAYVPSTEPTEAPTVAPTEAPTAEPTEAPTAEPTEAPTVEPTEAPTEKPTEEAKEKVTGVTYDAADTIVTFSWDAFEGAEKYWVYMYNEATQKWAVKVSSTTTTATVKKLKGGTDYQFKVTARVADADGTQILSLDDADVVSVTTAAPVAVGGGTAQADITSADLQWDAVEGAVKYWVYKSTSPDGPFYIYNSTTTTGLTAYKLKPETKYYFKVRVLTKVNGVENYSDVADSPVIEVQTKSKSLITSTVTNTTPNSVTLTWPALENADKYWVKMSKTSANPDDESAWRIMLSTTDTTATVTKLEPYTFYNFCVVARYTYPNGEVYLVNYVVNSLKTPKAQ